MKKSSFYLAAALLAAAGFAYAAEPLMLDFGSADSPLYEGFTAVTGKGNAQVKWVSKTELMEVAHKIKRGGRLDAYYTPLNCDYISGTGPAELKISVPPGNYKVWVLLGHPEGGVNKVWNNRISTSGSAVEINIPGNYEMRCAVMDAAADKDGLSVRFDTANSWLVNGMVVVPAADWEKVDESVIAPLWEEYEFLPKDVAKQWKKIPAPILDVYPEPKWSEQQKKDGFATFSRSQCAVIWPEDFPAAHEIDAPVRAFASWSEYETLSFSIHPLQDFRKVTLKVSDLVSAKGNRIAGELQKDYIRYMKERPHHNLWGTYYEGPDIVMPWQEQSLKKGRNLQIWLTAYVPPYTPAGDYKGTAEINLDGKVKQIPLTLKVLPITLQRDPDVYLSNYYRHPFWKMERAPDDFSRAWWLKKAEYEYAEMQKTGFTNHPQLHLQGSWKGDRWVYDYDALDRLLEFGRRYGFEGPFVSGFPFRQLFKKHIKEPQQEHLHDLKMPSDAFFTELTSMTREIMAEAKNRNWPKMYLYPVDEPSANPVVVEFVTRVLKAIKDGGGYTYAAVEPEDAATVAYRPYLDAWSTPKFTLTAAEVEAQRKQYPGTQYWCYPNYAAGSNDHVATPAARMTFGFGFWKSGFQGQIPWNYSDCYGDQWNFLDGPVADAMNHNADDASVIPVANWIAFREGLDDLRYIYTLTRWITTARNLGFKDAAATAEATLARLKDSIPALERYHNFELNSETFDAMRWQIAEQIMKLEKLVMKK